MVKLTKPQTTPSLGKDKMYHFLAGIMTVALGFALGLPIFVTILILFGVAIGKEVFDACGYGTPDLWDAVFTIIGGICLLILLWWGQRYMQKEAKK